MNKIFIRATEFTMKRLHVVKKQGWFEVVVSQNWTCFGIMKRFHCYENAMTFYRYHVSLLGWNFGCVQFVPSNYDPVVTVSYIDREVL